VSEQQSVSVILPAYNEAEVIGDVLDKLVRLAKEHNWEVIVVDDGSDDGTSQAAQRDGVKVIRHQENRGYGASIKTGIHAASGQIVAIMDSDGQHDEQDIPRLLEHIDQHDMVVGERVKGSYNDWMRKPGKWVLGKVANLLAGRKIPDLNSGLRAYRKNLLLKLIHLMPDGFSFSTTSTVAYLSMNLRVKYIPIKTRPRVGTSTVKQVRHGMGTILLMLRLIVLFNPLKVFLPASIVIFLTGIAYQVFIILREGWHVRGGAIVTLIAAIQTFLFGLMIDQISCIRREKYL